MHSSEVMIDGMVTLVPIIMQGHVDYDLHTVLS